MSENYFLNCHSEESIKVRWKKLSHELHPDKNNNPDANEKFNELIEQRDQAFRAIYKNSGKSEKQVQAALDDFIQDLTSTGKADLFGLANNMQSEIREKFGDEPKFGEVFAHVLKGMLGSYKKKLVEDRKDPPKQLE